MDKHGGLRNHNWNACNASFSKHASKRYPGYWDADQLYSLIDDPMERRNLGTDPRHAGQLARMRTQLKAHLRNKPHTFGEF